MRRDPTRASGKGRPEPPGRTAAPAVDTDYLEDVEYPSGFFHQLSPVHLNYVCALNGLEGPAVDGPFRYCEIGCGMGHTTNILAAANPNAEFWGIDISQRHITRAREQAAAGETANVTYIRGDIADLDFKTLPRFDYITLHGVYSWVPDDVRRGIVDFIDDRLVPRGITYVSYNTLPGWGTAVSLRQFFLDAVGRSPDDPLEACARVLDDLEELRTKEAPFFVENPMAGRMLDRLRAANIGYVAHEFLASSWRPLNFVDVNREMMGIGLGYAGSTTLFDNVPEHAVPTGFADRLAMIADPERRETEKDFICNSFFRADVYVRSDGSPVSTDPSPRLDGIRFGLAVTPLEVKSTVKVGGGQIDLAGPWLDRLTEILAFDALTMDEIAADPELGRYPADQLRNAVITLSFGEQLVPFAQRPVTQPASGRRAAAVPKLNQHLLDSFAGGKMGLMLASPVTGSGVGLITLEVILLRGLLAGAAVEDVVAEIADRKIRLKKDDHPLVDHDELCKAVAGLIELFRDGKLPKLVQLGIVEPGVRAAAAGRGQN